MEQQSGMEITRMGRATGKSCECAPRDAYTVLLGTVLTCRFSHADRSDNPVRRHDHHKTAGLPHTRQQTRPIPLNPRHRPSLGSLVR